MMIGAIFGSALLGRISPVHGQTMEELHQRALKEGGTVNFYGTLAQITAAKILGVFEKRFPGIRVNQVDATPDKLAARAIAEARGGKVLGDVFQTQLENIVQLHEQGLLLDKLPPEADAYPANFKGSYWLATEFDYIIGAWNTNLVKKEETPKDFDDFADPRWKGRLVAEPRDVELLVGLAKYKFKSDEKAIALLRKMAANNVQFHRGHSAIAELLVAGQAVACVTCFSHHYPPENQKRRAGRLHAVGGRSRDQRPGRVQGRAASQCRMAICPVGGERRRPDGLCPGKPQPRPSESGAGGENPPAKGLRVGCRGL